ncbi:MAG: dioxygenase [Eggerthellaceae bacterium]|nr:dioxygenase [Eggerthellaceae bacterium]
MPCNAVPKHVDLTYHDIAVPVPRALHACPGVEVAGRLIRSLVFSTDVALIGHCDADAVFAVYPFASLPTIMQSLVIAAERPVFAGVGGGVTSGERSAELALHAEMHGVAGVVLNATAKVDTIRLIASHVDIPVVLTVCEMNDAARAQIAAGASIVNVAAGRNTARVLAEVRDAYPSMPVIASSGPTEETAAATLAAGADALTWTPPNIQDIERALMRKNRAEG